MSEIETISALGRNWQWPTEDTKLRQVIHYVEDVHKIMQYVPEDRRAMVIQAGGACGVWPAAFSKYFERVITFEPHPVNYACLRWNTAYRGNVTAMQAALHLRHGLKAKMLRPDTEEKNTGAYYCQIDSRADIETHAIDDIELTACDLIQLDIEGAEYDALLGAQETIKEFWPVIVIEEKALPQIEAGEERQGRGYLDSLGYEQVGQVHRDVIFKKVAP